MKQRKLDEAKGRLKKMFSGRKDDPSEEQWDLSRDPFYKYDLREQIQVAPATDDKMDDRRYKKELFD